ncbi:MAG: hypothetical protein NTY53_07095 [Kiritimatiellaeota bacterium]|nr:hypothetical protein [Kiritimatiellota bacterium]
MKSMKTYSSDLAGRGVWMLVSLFLSLCLTGWGQTPTPITPTPITPTPITPTPIAPTPIAPTPIASTPIGPTPINATPINPTPINPTPINPTPINPIQTPAIQTPNIQTPNIQTPNIQTPNMQTPNIQTPNMQTPNIQTPNVQTPNIQTPDIQTPNMQTPSTMNPPSPSPIPDGIPAAERAALQQQLQALQANINQYNNDLQAYNNLPPADRTEAALKALVTRQSQLVNAINNFNRNVRNFAPPSQAGTGPMHTPAVATGPVIAAATTPPAAGGMSGGDAALIGVGVAGAVVAVAVVAGAAASAANNYKCAEGYSLCLDGVCCPSANINGVRGSYHFPSGCIGSAAGAANYAAHTGIVPSPCADERQQRQDPAAVQGMLRAALYAQPKK